MKKLAIIGSGIAGMAAAYYLRNRYHVEVFEKSDRVGGHTHTHTISVPGGSLAIDTGFIVYNSHNYPGLDRLLAELKVESQLSDMSFSVYNKAMNLQFSGEGLGKLFAQRRRIFSPQHIRFLLQANRFNSTAPEHALSGRADKSLGEYLLENGYSDYFIENFIFPMASAVWSTDRKQIHTFHAESFIRFFMNHGFLGLSGGRQWKTIAGGSSTYMKAIQSHLPRPVRTKHEIKLIRRLPNNVQILTDKGEFEFDYVLVATHANHALQMLTEPGAREVELLTPFQYSRNIATLHTDSSVMPPLRNIWASWNYKTRLNLEGENPGCTIYYMNRLQRLQAKDDYFVSINEMDAIDPEKLIAQIEYEHPIFNQETARAQKHLAELNLAGPVYFAGSYFGYGFHEDALASALRVVEKLS